MAYSSCCRKSLVRTFFSTKNKKSKDYCKADLKQRILFFITIFGWPNQPSSGLQMFLEIQRLQLAGTSSTVFAANLILSLLLSIRCTRIEVP